MLLDAQCSLYSQLGHMHVYGELLRGGGGGAEGGGGHGGEPVIHAPGGEIKGVIKKKIMRTTVI